jgi:hypothetical protein
MQPSTAPPQRHRSFTLFTDQPSVYYQPTQPHHMMDIPSSIDVLVDPCTISPYLIETKQDTLSGHNIMTPHQNTLSVPNPFMDSLHSTPLFSPEPSPIMNTPMSSFIESPLLLHDTNEVVDVQTWLNDMMLSANELLSHDQVGLFEQNVDMQRQSSQPCTTMPCLEIQTNVPQPTLEPELLSAKKRRYTCKSYKHFYSSSCSNIPACSRITST